MIDVFDVKHHLSASPLMRMEAMMTMHTLLLVFLLSNPQTLDHEPVVKRSSDDLPKLTRLKPNVDEPSMLDAFVGSKLEVEDGCVYLVSTKAATKSIAIFPAYFDLVVSDEEAIGVRNTRNDKKVMFGEIVTLGGGNAAFLGINDVEESTACKTKGGRAFLFF